MPTQPTEPGVSKVTVYVLSARFDDKSEWGEPTFYRKKKERDNDERMNRIIGEMRTYSYHEKMDTQEAEEVCI